MQHIPKIPATAIQKLHVGESCLIGPMGPTQVSAAFHENRGTYTQKQVIVIEPKTAEIQKMYVVTRIPNNRR